MELSGLLEKEPARPWPGQDMVWTAGLLSRRPVRQQASTVRAVTAPPNCWN